MVIDAMIIFRMMFNGKEFKQEFRSIEVFKNYLNNVPERAIQINYLKDLPQYRIRQNYAAVTDCQIILWVKYSDRVDEIVFTDAVVFGGFLKDHPEIGVKLGYGR